MIKLICENQLLFKTVSSYLLQKNILFSSNENYRILIKIQSNEKTINLDINGHGTEITLPIDINILNSKILKKIIDVSVPLGKHKYFPYQRIITNQNKKKVLLSDIQNLIISNLIINEKGIDKDNLYHLIWKKDKSTYINKLDTHLTNLKKKTKSRLKFVN